jgi:outer membrane protein TolC
MVKIIKYAYHLSAFLLITVITEAQQPLALTVEQAVAIGLEGSKSLHASMMKVQYSEAKASEINTTSLPFLKFSGSYTRLSEVPPFEIGPFQPVIPNKILVSPAVFDNYSMRLTMQQPIFTGFRLSKAADIAGYTAEASNGDYRKEEMELKYNIQRAYWSLFRAKEFKRVIDENVAQVEAHVKDIQNFFNQGIVTKNEVLKVEVQLSSIQLMQIEAGNAVRLATISLNSIIGIPLETELDLRTSLGFEDKNYGELKSLINQALENRPDLQAMALRVKGSEAGVGLARSGWFPQIFLQANYIYARPNSRIFPVQDRFNDTWDVSLTASFDVWNWGATIHQTDQAMAQLMQAQDGFAQLADGVVLDVTQAYLSLEQAKERITVAEKGVAQAEENYRITNQKFRSGLTLNSELLDSEVALLQAKFNYVQAMVDFKLADGKLLESVGMESNIRIEK